VCVCVCGVYGVWCGVYGAYVCVVCVCVCVFLHTHAHTHKLNGRNSAVKLGTNCERYTQGSRSDKFVTRHLFQQLSLITKTFLIAADLRVEIFVRKN
jgi:hypothetical protein